jgi:hypothetical protein
MTQTMSFLWNTALSILDLSSNVIYHLLGRDINADELRIVAELLEYLHKRKAPFSLDKANEDVFLVNTAASNNYLEQLVEYSKQDSNLNKRLCSALESIRNGKDLLLISNKSDGYNLLQTGLSSMLYYSANILDFILTNSHNNKIKSDVLLDENALRIIDELVERRARIVRLLLEYGCDPNRGSTLSRSLHTNKYIVDAYKHDSTYEDPNDCNNHNLDKNNNNSNSNNILKQTIVEISNINDKKPITKALPIDTPLLLVCCLYNHHNLNSLASLYTSNGSNQSGCNKSKKSASNKSNFSQKRRRSFKTKSCEPLQIYLSHNYNNEQTIVRKASERKLKSQLDDYLDFNRRHSLGAFARAGVNSTASTPTLDSTAVVSSSITLPKKVNDQGRQRRRSSYSIKKSNLITKTAKQQSNSQCRNSIETSLESLGNSSEYIETIGTTGLISSADDCKYELDYLDGLQHNNNDDDGNDDEMMSTGAISDVEDDYDTDYKNEEFPPEYNDDIQKRSVKQKQSGELANSVTPLLSPSSTQQANLNGRGSSMLKMSEDADNLPTINSIKTSTNDNQYYENYDNVSANYNEGMSDDYQDDSDDEQEDEDFGMENDIEEEENSVESEKEYNDENYSDSEDGDKDDDDEYDDYSSNIYDYELDDYDDSYFERYDYDINSKCCKVSSVMANNEPTDQLKYVSTVGVGKSSAVNRDSKQQQPHQKNSDENKKKCEQHKKLAQHHQQQQRNQPQIIVASTDLNQSMTHSPLSESLISLIASSSAVADNPSNGGCYASTETTVTTRTRTTTTATTTNSNALASNGAPPADSCARPNSKIDENMPTLFSTINKLNATRPINNPSLSVSSDKRSKMRLIFKLLNKQRLELIDMLLKYGADKYLLAKLSSNNLACLNKKTQNILFKWYGNNCVNVGEINTNIKTNSSRQRSSATDLKPLSPLMASLCLDDVDVFALLYKHHRLLFNYFKPDEDYELIYYAIRFQSKNCLIFLLCNLNNAKTCLTASENNVGVSDITALTSSPQSHIPQQQINKNVNTMFYILDNTRSSKIIRVLLKCGFDLCKREQTTGNTALHCLFNASGKSGIHNGAAIINFDVGSSSSLDKKSLTVNSSDKTSSQRRILHEYVIPRSLSKTLFLMLKYGCLKTHVNVLNNENKLCMQTLFEWNELIETVFFMPNENFVKVSKLSAGEQTDKRRRGEWQRELDKCVSLLIKSGANLLFPINPNGTHETQETCKSTMLINCLDTLITNILKHSSSSEDYDLLTGVGLNRTGSYRLASNQRSNSRPLRSYLLRSSRTSPCILNEHSDYIDEEYELNIDNQRDLDVEPTMRDDIFGDHNSHHNNMHQYYSEYRRQKRINDEHLMLNISRHRSFSFPNATNAAACLSASVTTTSSTELATRAKTRRIVDVKFLYNLLNEVIDLNRVCSYLNRSLNLNFTGELHIYNEPFVSVNCTTSLNKICNNTQQTHQNHLYRDNSPLYLDCVTSKFIELVIRCTIVEFEYAFKLFKLLCNFDKQLIKHKIASLAFFEEHLPSNLQHSTFAYKINPSLIKKLIYNWIMNPNFLCSSKQFEKNSFVKSLIVQLIVSHLFDPNDTSIYIHDNQPVNNNILFYCIRLTHICKTGYQMELVFDMIRTLVQYGADPNVQIAHENDLDGDNAHFINSIRPSSLLAHLLAPFETYIHTHPTIVCNVDNSLEFSNNVSLYNIRNRHYQRNQNHAINSHNHIQHHHHQHHNHHHQLHHHYNHHQYPQLHNYCKNHFNYQCKSQQSLNGAEKPNNSVKQSVDTNIKSNTQALENVLNMTENILTTNNKATQANGLQTIPSSSELTLAQDLASFSLTSLNNVENNANSTITPILQVQSSQASVCRNAPSPPPLLLTPSPSLASLFSISSATSNCSNNNVHSSKHGKGFWDSSFFIINHYKYIIQFLFDAMDEKLVKEYLSYRFNYISTPSGLFNIPNINDACHGNPNMPSSSLFNYLHFESLDDYLERLSKTPRSLKSLCRRHILNRLVQLEKSRENIFQETSKKQSQRSEIQNTTIIIANQVNQLPVSKRIKDYLLFIQ